MEIALVVNVMSDGIVTKVDRLSRLNSKILYRKSGDPSVRLKCTEKVHGPRKVPPKTAWTAKAQT